MGMREANAAATMLIIGRNDPPYTHLIECTEAIALALRGTTPAIVACKHVMSPRSTVIPHAGQIRQGKMSQQGMHTNRCMYRSITHPTQTGY